MSITDVKIWSNLSEELKSKYPLVKKKSAKYIVAQIQKMKVHCHYNALLITVDFI